MYRKRTITSWLAALFTMTMIMTPLALNTGCDRLQDLADELDLEFFDDDDDDFDFDDLDDDFDDEFDDLFDD